MSTTGIKVEDGPFQPYPLKVSYLLKDLRYSGLETDPHFFQYH